MYSALTTIECGRRVVFAALIMETVVLEARELETEYELISC